MASKIARILFPYDFSKHAETFLGYAYELALAEGAILYVQHNIDPRLRLSEFYALGQTHETAETVYLKLYNRHYASLKEITRRLVGVQVDSFITKGTTYKMIIDEAVKRQVDLIVLGTHGQKSVDYSELGSNAHRVLRLAPCPVLALKPSDFSPTGGEISPVPGL